MKLCCKISKANGSRFCSTCGNFLLDQILIWIPKGAKSITYKGKKPKWLWSLIGEKKEEKKPKIPFIPIHRKNAFLEDYLHDWDIISNKLIYRSRFSDGGHWLLLEYGEYNGKYTSLYPNGKKYCECTYKDGKRNGKYTGWYPNGKKRIECTYKNGKLNGKYIQFSIMRHKAYKG